MEKLNSQIEISNLIEVIKNKTPITISDIEQFYNLLLKLERDIQRLKESRDKWKNKYYELKS